jgi:diphosphomevalonate decarboxylase
MNNTVSKLLLGKKREPQALSAESFAPANIALCKYWGKRDSALNLPLTSSLSISLGEKGANTRISVLDSAESDVVILNQERLAEESSFVKKLSAYLDLFRDVSDRFFQVETTSNIPVAAGLASSACGFAALIKALDKLYAWELDQKALSILARLGSGSACRSLWNGFVEWDRGQCMDGLDSHGYPLEVQWPELRIGLLIFEPLPKKISSRMAMEHTVQTSPFYKIWPIVVEEDLLKLKRAIKAHDFETFGSVAEANALKMHALMMTAKTPIVYGSPKTLEAQHRIWDCRHQGLAVYFTQDAGPNLKLLFLAKDLDTVKQGFPELEVIAPFGESA